MPNTQSPLPEVAAVVSNGKAASMPKVDEALRNWALAAVPEADFSFSIPSGEAEGTALLISAWLYKVHALPQAKPARGSSELRLTLHYMLTVWCSEETRAHAALHSLFLAALTTPASPEGLQLAHLPEPLADSFWLALKLPPRPCLLLTAELILPRPPIAPAPLPRKVVTRIVSSSAETGLRSPQPSSSKTT